jgi:type IV fimbrial biogenesis protein FimT
MTAIELLMWLAVAAVVLLIAIPGGSMLIERHRLKSASADLISSLYLARSEAQVRASMVKVCPSADRRTCRTDGDWSKGWLVFSDGNGDGIVQEIELLESFEAPGKNVQIRASGAARDRAAFTATGLVRDHGSARGRLALCPKGRGSGSQVISIDADGWVRMEPSDRTACETG